MAPGRRSSGSVGVSCAPVYRPAPLFVRISGIARPPIILVCVLLADAERIQLFQFAAFVHMNVVALPSFAGSEAIRNVCSLDDDVVKPVLLEFTIGMIH